MPNADGLKQALRDIEAGFVGLIDAAPQPIVIYNLDMKAAYINPAFEETFGWSLDELFGKRIHYFPEDRLSETDRVIKRVLSGEKVKSFETKRLTKEGKIRDVLLNATLFANKGGEPVGVVVGLHDITDRKRAEEERAKREKLQGVLEMAGAACHELNQPLQAAYILLDGLMEETQNNHANTLKIQLDRVRTIIRKIENITVYKTMDYVQGEQIVDIEKASRRDT